MNHMQGTFDACIFNIQLLDDSSSRSLSSLMLGVPIIAVNDPPQVLAPAVLGQEGIATKKHGKSSKWLSGMTRHAWNVEGGSSVFRLVGLRMRDSDAKEQMRDSLIVSPAREQGVLQVTMRLFNGKFVLNESMSRSYWVREAPVLDFGCTVPAVTASASSALHDDCFGEQAFSPQSVLSLSGPIELLNLALQNIQVEMTGPEATELTVAISDLGASGEGAEGRALLVVSVLRTGPLAVDGRPIEINVLGFDYVPVSLETLHGHAPIVQASQGGQLHFMASSGLRQDSPAAHMISLHAEAGLFHVSPGGAAGVLLQSCDVLVAESAVHSGVTSCIVASGPRQAVAAFVRSVRLQMPDKFFGVAVMHLN